MLLLQRLWLIVCYTSFLSVIITSVDKANNIIWLTRVEGVLGQNVTLMWNTTNNKPIKSAIFGLSKDGMADPQFINVNMLTGKVHYNPKMTKAYSGRVDFVGNLTAGWAWFVIKNVQLNDANEYIARITVEVDTVMSYSVKLNVRQSKEFQDQKEPTASSTTKEWTSLNETVGKGPYGTTSSPPVGAMAPVMEYTLVATAIMIILSLILITTWFWKKRNKSKSITEHEEASSEPESSKTSLIRNNNSEEKIPEKKGLQV